MIPYMVGKLAPNSSHLTRGLIKDVPGRGYFRAVSSLNGDKYVTPPPPPPNRRTGRSVMPVNSKMSFSARMLLPPTHPMTTAFGSIRAEFNEWTRGLCPAGLVSVVGKSGVKVTASSTVRGSASLLLIPSIPNWPRSTPSSTGPSGPR